MQVSIDGPMEYHDKFRGVKGTFQRASAAIETMTNAGVSVSLVTTVCRDNMNYLSWLADWATRMHIKQVTVQPLYQIGRGFELGDKKLSDSQLCALLILLSDLSSCYRSE